MRQWIDLLEASSRKKTPPIPPSAPRLKDGRSILPEPKGTRWVNVGKPVSMEIDKLDLHPDGLATAMSAFLWNPTKRHENNKPVDVTMVDGIPHVLDGYHRVVQANRDGETTIMVQKVK